METKKYEIKYIAKKIDSALERTPIGYCVTQAFLVAKNGPNSFSVVCPWSLQKNQLNTPIFKDSVCINAEKVEKVFEDKEECQKYADRLNAELLSLKLSEVSIYNSYSVCETFRASLKLMENLSKMHENDIKKVQSCEIEKTK